MAAECFQIGSNSQCATSVFHLIEGLCLNKCKRSLFVCVCMSVCIKYIAESTLHQPGGHITSLHSEIHKRAKSQFILKTPSIDPCCTPSLSLELLARSIQAKLTHNLFVCVSVCVGARAHITDIVSANSRICTSVAKLQEPCLPNWTAF